MIFWRILKSVLFAAIILAVGQIPLGHTTLGAEYINVLRKRIEPVVDWSAKRLEYAGVFPKESSVGKILEWQKKAKLETPKIKQPQAIRYDEETGEPEPIPAADKQALLELLK